MKHDFFLGGGRSRIEPDGEITHERKHHKGVFIGLFRRNDGRIFVSMRENRHRRYIQAITPDSTSFWADPDIDEPFMDEGYWGFTDPDKAMAYYQHVINTPDHPQVCEAYIPSRSHIRDSQKSKVYLWERKFYRKHKRDLGRDGTVDLARQIEREMISFATQPMEIKLVRSGNGRCFQRGTTEIQLASWGWNNCTTTHEAAHWVVSNRFQYGPVQREVAGHGPEFVGIFMLMMERYCGANLTDMINYAIKKKVQFIFPEGGIESLLKDATCQ